MPNSNFVTMKSIFLSHRFFLLFGLLMITTRGFTQIVNGTVYGKSTGKKEEPLLGATVKWKESKKTAVTDKEGHFSINQSGDEMWLIASYIGYKKDSVMLMGETKVKIVLKESNELGEATVTAKRDSGYVSKFKPINAEIIGQHDLLKAACCNLSESFENSASVEVNFPDALSGAKQIRMLGLDGVYSQMLFENIPFLRHSSSSYGLSQVPGPWIQSIQVTKGTGSVVNGFESIAGQINLEFQKPHDDYKYNFNVYADMDSRTEMNAILRSDSFRHWKSALLIHGDKNFMKIDNNRDGFLDQPLSQSFSAMNRWNYDDGGHREAQIVAQVISDERKGGQMNYDFNKTQAQQDSVYGTSSDMKAYDLFTKNGFMFPEKPYKSVGFIVYAFRHETGSAYGFSNYSGIQNGVYSNFIHQTIINTTTHKIKYGGSFFLDDLTESFKHKLLDTTSKRLEYAPGVFTEYTYNEAGKFTAVAGLRADYLSKGGLLITPRLHLRYQPLIHLTARLSAGTGARFAAPFAENFYLMASSKTIQFQSTNNTEKALNMGGSLMFDFKMNKKKGYLTVEYFRTDFMNKVITDRYVNPFTVWIYNSNKPSISNAFQAELDFYPQKYISLKIAGKITDVKEDYKVGLKDKIFTPKNRELITVNYTSRLKKWNADLTTVRYGKSAYFLATPYSFLSYTKPFYLVNTQLTRNFRNFSIYAGAENLTNYTQKSPIIDSENPFGNNFDATLIWAPIMGTRIYGGIRINLK